MGDYRASDKRLAAAITIDMDTPKYRIIHVPLGSTKHDATPAKVAQPPRYDRERDEPAFEKAWARVAEMKAQGKLAPLPPFPKDGIKLRGRRHQKGE